jgi:hypothetical protein
VSRDPQGNQMLEVHCLNNNEQLKKKNNSNSFLINEFRSAFKLVGQNVLKCFTFSENQEYISEVQAFFKQLVKERNSCFGKLKVVGIIAYIFQNH